MPELTQQQWMEKLFRSEMSAIAFPYMDGPTVLANRLASAWPSSPQGLAVKQVMEALESVREAQFEAQGEWASVSALYAPEWTHPLKDSIGTIDEAKEAARKAGLA